MLFEKGNTYGRHKNRKGGRPSRFDEQEIQCLFDSSFPMKQRRAVIRRQVEKALGGDVEACRWLFDRVYGRAKQQVTHGGNLSFEYASSWADIEQHCRELGIDPQLARLEAKRLIESADTEDEQDDE